jgi:hypothetical protein
MSFKRLLPKFLLVAGFISLSFIIIYQDRIKDFLRINYDKAREYVDYISYDLNFEFKRHRPLSLLERETELKLYIGEPFRSFNKSGWETFWIYPQPFTYFREEHWKMFFGIIFKK